jgi:hypothetical protein
MRIKRKHPYPKKKRHNEIRKNSTAIKPFLPLPRLVNQSLTTPVRMSPEIAESPGRLEKSGERASVRTPHDTFSISFETFLGHPAIGE